MKKLISISIAITFIFNMNMFSQTKQDLKYATSNIAFNSLIGGFGAMLHKNKHETLGHAFVNGMLKGSLSGSLNYISKEMLTMQNHKDNLDWKIFWSSKIINSFANTIQDNAINNESLLTNYHINIGFIRLSTNKKIEVEPVSLGCMGYVFLTGGKLNVQTSLITGTPIFDYNFKRIYTKTKDCTTSRPEHLGVTYGQNIMLQSNVSNHAVLVHEVVHTYQRAEYICLNNFFSKKINIKYIHNDLSLMDASYLIQKLTLGYNNISFEKESVHFEK